MTSPGRPGRPDNNASQSSFPTDPANFADDERISWSRLDNKHILETEQGAEYEWDEALKRWVAVVSALSLTAQHPDLWAENLFLYVERTPSF